MLATAVAGACGGEPAPAPQSSPASEPWLRDASAASGLDFVHDPGFDGSFAMPEILGPGVCVFDANRDAWLDVYLVNGARARGARDGLWLGEGGLRWRRGPQPPAGDAFGMGCTVGDVDNDGDLDLYLTNYGADELLLNDGEAVFERRELAGDARVEGWSSSAGFFDADGDGLLDLWVTRYVRHRPDERCTSRSGRAEYCGPLAFPAESDVVLRNRGAGRFEAVPTAGPRDRPGRGLGLVFDDFDQDGRLDVYVANDGESNHLWLNRSARGELRFEEVAALAGAAVNGAGQAEASMGVALGDVDGDGSSELVLSHLDQERNTLYRRVGPAAFVDATPGSGIGEPSLAHTGFGLVLADFDHDGVLDLAVANGKVRLAASAPQGETGSGGDAATGVDRLAAYAEPNLLLIGLGDGRFRSAPQLAGPFASERGIGRGLVAADLDRDGDLDLLLTRAAGSPSVYENVATRAGRWLQIRAIDPRLRRDAVGALVEVRTVAGRGTARVAHASSYLSATSATMHFGLGEVERVEEIVVHWLGGGETRVARPEVDAMIEVVREDGR